MARKGKIFVGAFVDPELAKRLDDLAEKKDMNRSELLTKILKAALPEKKSVEQSGKGVKLRSG
jgi:metal-responsive CopG/Arc/MetJ family transcriptional regulator